MTNNDEVPLDNINVTNSPIRGREQRASQDQNTSYTTFQSNELAHKKFDEQFKHNTFGHACSICDRLWFLQDLKSPLPVHKQTLRTIFPDFSEHNTRLCGNCSYTLAKQKIPSLSVLNGFKFPEFPANLPPLDLLSERLISPRLPFMQIRRLRHVSGQYAIYGQIINVPVDFNNMVNKLPQNVDDDYCINVHLKKKIDSQN